MQLIVSHYSAANFWRCVYPASRTPSKPTTARNITETASSAENVWQLAPQWVTRSFLMPEHGILHSLSISADRTYRTKTTVSHVCKYPLPDGSLYALSKDVYVCSPEFVFLQLAQSLSLTQLIAFGCEVCGTYSFDASTERGFRNRKTPLTTKTQLKRFIDSAQGMRGRKHAVEALRHIIENAASPMETTCALLLSLPYRLGGYNLPKPIANKRIEIPSSLKSVYPSEYCVADLCIPESKLIVEYLGAHDHSGMDSLRNDRGRTVALREMGYEVVEITAKQAWNLDAFEIVAKRISKACDKRIRSGEFGATAARLKLRQELSSWNAASGRPDNLS